MHADQIAAVERVREKAGRKGVEVVPDWLRNVSFMWKDTRIADGWMEPDAAALIVTGALAKWLAGQGIAVVSSYGLVEWVAYKSWERQWVDLRATDHLSALLAATLARLDELPDKEKA